MHFDINNHAKTWLKGSLHFCISTLNQFPRLKRWNLYQAYYLTLQSSLILCYYSAPLLCVYSKLSNWFERHFVWLYGKPWYCITDIKIYLGVFCSGSTIDHWYPLYVCVCVNKFNIPSSIANADGVNVWWNLNFDQLENVNKHPLWWTVNIFLWFSGVENMYWFVSYKKTCE